MILLMCLALTAAGFIRSSDSGVIQYISGGKEVTSNTEYPWVVSLRNSKGKYGCMGYLTAVNGNQLVITTAHCVFNDKKSKSAFLPIVQAGTELSGKNFGVERKVSRTFVDFQYPEVANTHEDKWNHDFAILIPEYPFDYTTSLQPAPLQTVPVDKQARYGYEWRKWCKMIGWGHYDDLNQTIVKSISPRLRELDAWFDQNNYNEPHKLPISPVNRTMGPNLYRQAWWGDSGGPLACKKDIKYNDPSWHVLGILSRVAYNGTIATGNLKEHRYVSVGAYRNQFDVVEIFKGERQMPIDKRYPFVASLRDASGRHVCGGFLTGAYTVITTASCVYDIKSGKRRNVTSVVIGSKVLKGVNFGKEKNIQAHYVHRDYLDLPNKNNNDLGVVSLHEPVKTKRRYAQYQTVTARNIRDWRKCKILFWGEHSEGELWRNNINIRPHVRMIKGSIVAITPLGTSGMGPLTFVQKQKRGDFTKYNSMKFDTDKGSPIVCKHYNLTGLHVVGVMQGRGWNETASGHLLRYVNVGYFGKDMNSLLNVMQGV